MTDFIKVYDSVISAKLCEQTITAFYNQQKTNFISGLNDTADKVIAQVNLNYFKQNQALVAELVACLLPYFTDYFAQYFQALLSGTSLTVYHPKSGQPVKLSADNFEQVGRPQLPLLINQIFRLENLVVEQNSATHGFSSHFKSDYFPAAQSDEALHRIINFNLFLNDVTSGGGIEFNHYERKIAAKHARLVIYPAYFTHSCKQLQPNSQDQFHLSSHILFQRSQQMYRQI